MKLHDRTMPCQKAEADLHATLIDWLERHPDLTWAEAVRCLASMISNYAKYPVREERHPDDPNRKADEAPD